MFVHLSSVESLAVAVALEYSLRPDCSFTVNSKAQKTPGWFSEAPYRTWNLMEIVTLWDTTLPTPNSPRKSEKGRYRLRYTSWTACLGEWKMTLKTLLGMMKKQFSCRLEILWPADLGRSRSVLLLLFLNGNVSTIQCPSCLCLWRWRWLSCLCLAGSWSTFHSCCSVVAIATCGDQGSKTLKETALLKASFDSFACLVGFLQLHFQHHVGLFSSIFWEMVSQDPAVAATLVVISNYEVAFIIIHHAPSFKSY